MLGLILFLTCILVALGTAALSAWSDFKGMTIPNIYSFIIFGAFVVCYGGLYALGQHNIVFMSPWSHAISAAVILLFTAIMFVARAIGAADSKMATAVATWTGIAGVFPFLFYMAFTGGILAVYALSIRGKDIFKNPIKNGWIDQVQRGESKVPYGIAIFLGMVGSFIQLGFFDPSLWLEFLSS